MNEVIDIQGSYLVVKNSSNNEFVASRLIVDETVSDNYQWQVTVLVSSASPSDWIGDTVTCRVYDVTGTNRSSIREFKGYVVKAQAQSQRIDATNLQHSTDGSTLVVSTQTFQRMSRVSRRNHAKYCYINLR